MAFWGVELKPGNPYKHRYDQARGRLHISQATLGSGQSTKKSVIVQCNVGNKSPVLLCSLLPEKTESCSLNLEFEEVDEVIFSVIGQRSVHLTGFYLGRSHNFDRNGDDSDSYGEDIAETETDQSSDHDTEDEYEDDFIDDGDIDMFPPSPRPNSGVTIEEIVDDDVKPANRSGATKRLKKKYQLSDSDSGDDSKKQIVVKGSRISVLESEDEDGFPISTTSKSKCIVKKADSEDKSVAKITSEDGMKEKANDDSIQGACLKRKVDAIDQDSEHDRGASQLSDSFAPSGVVATENGGKSKKKKKEKVKNEKFLHTEERASGDQAIGGGNSDVLNNLKTGVGEEKILNMDQDLPINDELKEKLSNDKEVTDSTIPLDTIAPESSGKLKKKRKGKAKEKTPQSEVEPSAEMEDKACSNDDSKPPDTKKSLDHNVDPAGADSQNDGKKKKKKKSKTHKGDKSADGEESQPAMEEAKNKLIEKIDDQKTQVRPSKARTFSNGLVIEELSMGKPDSKRASPGNKVSVHYIGKLKKNGEIFDSNIGRRPFKFRLGIGEVIKGWDVGVAGMHIGDKRRLTIPPSMAYGTEGAGKIPANAWLIFDVELVEVQ